MLRGTVAGFKKDIPITTYSRWAGGDDMRNSIRQQLDNMGIDAFMLEGAQKISTQGGVEILHEYLVGGEGFDMNSGDEVYVVVLANANKDILGITYKSREELGTETFYNLRNAFEMAETDMTDAIWSMCMSWFSITLTVSTSAGVTTISDGGQSILVNASTHAMKYGTNGLWANDTTTEYNTIQTNGWLVDGTYTYQGANQDWIDVSNSIKSKSHIVYTVTVSTDGGHTTISDGTESILYNTSTQGLLYNADYYAEEPNATALSEITSEGWLVDGSYGYASVTDKKSDWDNIVALLKVSCVSNATIIHDTVNGEITIANGNYSMTIMDKNLGASVAYEDGDTLSEANCGNYFQWGNNYGFTWAGDITITTNSVVNTQNYGPGNYYSSSTFRAMTTNQGDRSNNRNDNLWGNTTNTDQARQGPAPSGYHVPSATEWENLINFFNIIRPNAHSGNDFKTEFLIPFAGYRAQTSGQESAKGIEGSYWSSSIGPFGYVREAKKMNLNSSNVGISRSGRAFGGLVRCFKDAQV